MTTPNKQTYLFLLLFIWLAGPAAAENTGSDASFDKRLPPVLPGEEVNDGGKKSKVWSTTGPVPVSEDFDTNSKSRSSVDGIGVVVDERYDRSNRWGNERDSEKDHLEKDRYGTRSR